MPHLKRYVSGYRPPSLNYTTSNEVLSRQATDYLEWLACERGLAFDYIETQRVKLNQIAYDAVDRIRQRLFKRGLRPIIWGQPIANIAEYDHREDERKRLNAELDVANAAADQARVEIEASPKELQLEWLNSGWSPPWRDYEQRADELRNAMRRLGHADLSRWAFPGLDKTLHVGITGPRGGRDHTKPDATIVIKPGRSPSDLELDSLIEDAIDTLFGPLLAAQVLQEGERT